MPRQLRAAVGIAAFGIILGLTAGLAFAGIGIFSDSGGSDCNLTLPLGVSKQIYVLYLGQGGPMANGAEYRIFGMPGQLGVRYTATLTPAPGTNLNLGNAFDGVGHNVAWPAVQPFDGNGNLLLATYTLTSLTATVPAGTILTVTQRPSTVCTTYCCPLTTDANFNFICQEGGSMRVNGGPLCTVAVEQRTWTGVRNLYR